MEDYGLQAHRPLLEQLLHRGALFLVENALSMSAAVTLFLFACTLMRMFTDVSEERPPKQSGPKRQQQQQGQQGGGEPRPRWEVLSVLNYTVMGVFVSSITYVVFNYRTMSRATDNNGGLFPVLVIWCACMAYFFGFFGISFLDKNAMARSPSSFGLGQLDQHLSSSPPPPARHAGEEGGGKYLASSHQEGLMCGKEVPEQAAMGVASSAGMKMKLETIPEGDDYACMTDQEVVSCVMAGKLKDHQLEGKLKDHLRAVRVRRRIFESRIGRSMHNLPLEGYDYERIFGANCEIVCGYIQVPVGVVGPLQLDGEEVYVPMATTEGCLVASTNRGCKAITQGGGARSAVQKDGITRAPCLRMPDAMSAVDVQRWVEEPANFAAIKQAFEATTSFGKLNEVMARVAGRNVYLRFVCQAGDAMGMNMVSKGCLAVIDVLQQAFPPMELVAISGNMCTDKKPAAINWIEGRGKSVVCEARIPRKYVEATLKTTVKAMVQTNIQKNLVGSALAGALGGFNAHASNIVTAVFLATGQDPAQNVESSTCMTLMEEMEDNGDLLVSVNMPSIEVGTVGGGTSLPGQQACLDMVGCRGATKAPGRPGDNARKLARVVAGATLAGELSLVAALASNQLVRAHMQHNRKAPMPSAK